MSALFSLGPGVLARLFGGDSNAKLRAMVAKLTNPANVTALTSQFNQANIGSPAYQQALGTIASGANATQGNIARELGARGIGTSGTGAILSSITPSIVGSQQAGLRTTAYNAAQGQAQGTIQQQLAALMGTQGPSQSGQLFGAGLDAFGPMLAQWLRSRGMGGGANYGGQGGAWGPGGPIQNGAYR